MIQQRDDVQIAPATPAQTTRVLMIDDDGTFCALVSGVLKRHNYEVVTCAHPAKALEMYTRQQDTIQLVLLDYFMPGLDGGTTLTHLRRLNPRVKVILCSGVDELRLRRLMNELPLDGYIHKPLRLPEVLETFRRVLGT